MRFGSHLYGTATTVSDLDLKGVYLPAAHDILLQRVKATFTSNRVKAPGQKNEAGDVDSEVYSLQRYLDLLAEGQTVALDMLFAPDAAMTISPSPWWREIQAKGHRLISRRATSFVQYCRQQANKYGIKGSRVAAARKVLAMLTTAQERLGNTAKLELIAAELTELDATTAHVKLIDLPSSGDRSVQHLEVCDRKISFSASLKTAREIAQRLVDEYGQRALQAEPTRESTGKLFLTLSASAVKRSNSFRPAVSPFLCPTPTTSSASSAVRFPTKPSRRRSNNWLRKSKQHRLRQACRRNLIRRLSRIS